MASTIPNTNPSPNTVTGKDIETLVAEKIHGAVLYSDEDWVLYDLAKLLDPEVVEEVEVWSLEHVILRFRDGRLLDLVCLDDYVQFCIEKTSKPECRNACRSLV